MTRAQVILVGMLLAFTGPAMADTAREIGAAELRKMVKAGETISLKSLVTSVARSTEAEPIEARAFYTDGVFYRVVMKRPDGTLISMVFDATNGKQITPTSSVGKKVRDAAVANMAGKTSKGKGQPAGGTGKGNAGGNGKGGGNGGGGNGGGGGGNGGGGGGGNGGGKG
jgi:hypothetical protein